VNQQPLILKRASASAPRCGLLTAAIASPWSFRTISNVVVVRLCSESLERPKTYLPARQRPPYGLATSYVLRRATYAVTRACSTMYVRSRLSIEAVVSYTRTRPPRACRTARTRREDREARRLLRSYACGDGAGDPQRFCEVGQVSSDLGRVLINRRRRSMSA